MSEAWNFVTGLFMTVAAMAGSWFGGAQPPTYFGYVEADYVYVAPVSPGRIDQMPVAQGDRVKKGDVLFVQTTDQQTAVLHASEARVQAAGANLRNLESGSRQAEMDVLNASLAQAQSEQALAKSTLDRSRKLEKSGVISAAQFDNAQSRLTTASARVAQLQAQLKVAELPARNAQIAAAEANLRAAEADARQARLALDDRTIRAPRDGVVERILFSNGEMAQTGQPVVSLLPPRATKVRFYIPEPDRSQFQIGETVDISCDGCAKGLTATLNYMAEDPQNTPPVIYSREERARMVFMAEARLPHNSGILPGQPVSVMQRARP